MICAAEQSQAWEMQSQIWAISDANGPGAYTKALLSAQAETLGLDRSQFNQCYDSAETRGTAQAVNVEADARGVQGTPTLFVNGVNVPYRGADAAYQDMVRAIESALGG
jgi:protein-disulfide isomerase